MKNINILNNLNSGKTSSYFTTNGTKEFTCNNAGYVDNVVIEGETLVNLVRNNLSIQIWHGDRYVIDLTECGYLKGTYTIFNLSNKKIYQDIGVAGNTSTWLKSITIEPRQSITFDIVEGEQISNVSGAFIDGWENTDTSRTEFRESIVILEGNHTDKPISYFEGLKSVGQGDNIEVLTYNKINNLIEDTFTYTKDMLINYTNGEFRSVTGHYACDNYIKIEPSTDYMFVGINGNRAYYDENKQVVPPINNSYLQVLLDKTNGSKKNFSVEKSPSNARYIRITIHKDNLVGGKAYLYKSSNYDHKQISTTLRSLSNGVKDTIEKRGSKYVKVQRCGEVVLDGNVDVPNIYKPNSSLNYHRFLVSVEKTPNFGVVCCDRLGSVVDYEIEKDNILADKTYSGFFITLHNDKTGGTREGFKTWLQANPITVVYELATPQIIELPNFNPQTYKGDNTLIVNSGVIQCDASFDVCEGIRSELDVIKDKVSSLDDTTTTINYRNLRNDITFLNGWGIWGNEARFNCYVADNVVKICILLAPSVLTPYTPIFKLPAQYITGRKEFITCVDNNKRCYMGALDETCMFSFENEISSESMYVSINFTYPLIKKVI